MSQLNSLNEIHYERPLPGGFARIADALAGQLIFEYKVQVRDLRMLQASMMGLAQVLLENPKRKAILLIDETRISAQRMKREWESYQHLLHPSIANRLCLAVFEMGALTRVHGNLSPDERQCAETVQTKLSSNHDRKKPRSPDYFLDIFRVLLINWFRRNGSLPVKDLCRWTGFSYPTVAAALEKMERYLLRHSDRSVELRDFPREFWRKLLADNELMRMPVGFAARQPRPIEVLLDGLKGHSAFEIGFGGILGARSYLPGIDLVGTHRLDLTLPNIGDDRVIKLVRRLDPGLKPAEPDQAPQVVIHRLFRPTTYFTDCTYGKVADEVECLLDLYEARLETQANELQEHLIQKART